MNDLKEQIRQNLDQIEINIQEAVKDGACADKPPVLIAVSKTKPLPYLKAAYELGVRDFGENKVQELTDKYENMPKDVRWHMIGHLQTNKVKYLVGKTILIHSVDSFRLAAEIQKEALKKNLTVDILIEVNVAEEDSKYGVSYEQAETLIREISVLSNVHIRGLMTVAPFVHNSMDNRSHFEKLKQLSVDIKGKNIDNVCMDFLSMGMTGDYDAAISAGATHIRVGTGLFGERLYPTKDN